jgi:DNA-binding PadR family transcriptional regulator
VVLALLDEAPRHGYEIIRWIEDRCRGGYSPSPGVIYPPLTMLEEQDLTRADPASETGKRRYVITDAGRRHAAENQGLIKGAFARMDMVARMRARELLPPRVAQAMETLKQALLSRGTNWDVQEADRVAAVLEHAALLIIDPTHQNGPDSV